MSSVEILMLSLSKHKGFQDRQPNPPKKSTTLPLHP